MGDQFSALLETLKSGAEQLPRRKQLMILSDMTREEQRAFREAWPHIPLQTRRRLVGALNEMTESDALAIFDHVFLVALDDPDDEVRLGALQGLWECEDETLVPRLISLMNQDPSVPVRAEAAMNLGRFALAGEEGKIEPDMAAVIRSALIAVWNSPEQDTEVRRRALESVSCFSGDDIAKMIWAAYNDKDERMNVSAVYAMGQTLDECWAPYVMKELKNPRPEMRYEAARAAGQLQLTDAIPVLLDMVHDADVEVRTAATLALGDIGGERAVQALLELAKGKDEAVREAALDALEFAQFFEDPLAPLVMDWTNRGTVVKAEDLDDEWDEDLYAALLEEFGEDWDEEDDGADEDEDLEEDWHRDHRN